MPRIRGAILLGRWSFFVLFTWTTAAQAVETQPAAVWIDASPVIDAETRDAITVMLAELLARGQVLRESPSQNWAAPPAITFVRKIESLTDTGLMHYDDVDMDSAAAALTEALGFCRQHPWGLHSDKVPTTILHRAVMSLVHAKVLLGDAASAQDAAKWWWNANPGAPKQNKDFPSAINHLVTNTTAGLVYSPVPAQIRSKAREQCVFVANGVRDIPPESLRLGAGLHAVQPVCGKHEGWIRKVTIVLDQLPTALRSAPEAEAAVSTQRIPWSFKGEVAPHRWYSLAPDLAFVLGQPVAVPLVSGQSERFVAILRFTPDGRSEELARRTLPGNVPAASAAPADVPELPSPANLIITGGDAQGNSSSLATWGWITFGAGLVAVGAAAGLHGWHNATIRNDDLTASQYDTFASARPAIVATYAAGGALLAASATLWILEWTRDEPGATISFSPGLGSLSIQGRF